MKDERIVSYMLTLGLEMHDAEHFFDIIVESAECTKNGVRERVCGFERLGSGLDTLVKARKINEQECKIEERHQRWGENGENEGPQEVDIDTFIEHSMAMKGSASALDMRRQMHQLQKVSEKLEADGKV